MKTQEAQEYVTHRLANYMGRGSDILNDQVMAFKFADKVTMVINELIQNHHFVILSDFSDHFRLASIHYTEDGFIRNYEQIR